MGMGTGSRGSACITRAGAHPQLNSGLLLTKREGCTNIGSRSWHFGLSAGTQPIKATVYRYFPVRLSSVEVCERQVAAVALGSKKR